jgi:hypothetical protein
VLIIERARKFERIICQAPVVVESEDERDGHARKYRQENIA